MHGISNNLHKVLKKAHNDTMANALGGGSGILEGLQSSIACINARFSYSRFSEEEGCPNVGKIGDTESASLYLPKEKRNPLLANHLSVSRSRSVDETGFKRVVIDVKIFRAAAMRDPIPTCTTPSLTGLGGRATPLARSYPSAPCQ